jgi:ribosomal protein S18 acetylase RimI-like enzyme
MPIEIRQAAVEDVDAIASVKRAVWRDEAADGAHIAGILARADHATHVAESHGVIVGFVDGFVTHSVQGVPRWEVDLLAVHPEHQRQGIAARLVAASAGAGRSQGAAIARGLVHVENVASQRAFARCGYQVDEQVCALYVSSDQIGSSLDLPSGLHFILVNTLNYRGVWLEGQLSPAGFTAAQWFRAQRGLDISGAVVPLSQVKAVQAAQEAGYHCVGDYQWWLRAC